MNPLDRHISDEDLLRAADGESSASESVRIRTHLAACWTCRARSAELEAAIAYFVQARQEAYDSSLSPSEGERALLKLRLQELAAATPSTRWWPPFSPLAGSRTLKLSCAALLSIGLLFVAAPPNRTSPERRSVPDPRLTPGATLPVTKDDVCDTGAVETVRVVSEPVARKVFAAYGIHQPPPRSYELDYLITPALGGDDNIRNFWPQPYQVSVWNAHLKDALEDKLHDLVCAGKLDLSRAQRDIAEDWIAAYKKYFHTERPLSVHATYLRDRPWE